MDLKEQEALGDAIHQHWYFRAKLAALRHWIAGLAMQEVLDVGAGSGFFAQALLETTSLTAGTCVDPGYPGDFARSVGGKPLRFTRGIDSSGADLVLMMDVLEHVDDDVGLLHEYARKTPAGACFVISVPAFQWLWSGHDVFLEHRRRYTLPQIESVVRAAGLEVRRGAYFFAAVFPLAAAVRLLSRIRASSDAIPPRSQLRRHGAVVNRTLGALCRAEMPFLAINRAFGLTAFVLAGKARAPSGPA